MRNGDRSDRSHSYPNRQRRGCPLAYQPGAAYPYCRHNQAIKWPDGVSSPKHVQNHPLKLCIRTGQCDVQMTSPYALIGVGNLLIMARFLDQRWWRPFARCGGRS